MTNMSNRQGYCKLLKEKQQNSQSWQDNDTSLLFIIIIHYYVKWLSFDVCPHYLNYLPCEFDSNNIVFLFSHF